MDELRRLFHTVGFWALVIFIAGIIAGGYGMSLDQKSRLNEAKQLGGFVFEKKIYDIKERP